MSELQPCCEEMRLRVVEVIETGGERYGTKLVRGDTVCKHGYSIHQDCIACYDESIYKALYPRQTQQESGE